MDPRFTITERGEAFGELVDRLIDEARGLGLTDDDIATVLEDRAGRERRRVDEGVTGSKRAGRESGVKSR